MRACASSSDSSLVDGEQTSRDLGLDRVLFPKREIFVVFFKSRSQPQRRRRLLLSRRRPTCAFPYDGVEFGAKKSLGVVEYELHHHRLDAHLHEGRRAAKTCRLDLPGPGGSRRSITCLTNSPNHWPGNKLAGKEFKDSDLSRKHRRMIMEVT